jgi:hypothetical protein
MTDIELVREIAKPGSCTPLLGVEKSCKQCRLLPYGHFCSDCANIDKRRSRAQQWLAKYASVPTSTDCADDSPVTSLKADHHIREVPAPISYHVFPDDITYMHAMQTAATFSVEEKEFRKTPQTTTTRARYDLIAARIFHRD